MKKLNSVVLIGIFFTCVFLHVRPFLAMEGEDKQDISWAQTAKYKLALYLAAQTTPQNSEDESNLLTVRMHPADQALSCERKKAKSERCHFAQEQQKAEIHQAFQLEHPVSAVEFVPFTKKVLIAELNKLHRVEAGCTQEQVLAFEKPITRLLSSRDGSLCAALLASLTDDRHTIQFFNPCKTQLELDSDINPIPYFRTNEYTILQEADISPDARFLAVIINASTACIFDLKNNKPHNVIEKGEEDFPVFSVNFMKKNKELHELPDDHNILAIHTNLETILYRINEAECTIMQKISHKNLVPNNNYFCRQGAWIQPQMLMVLLGKKLVAYKKNEKKGQYSPTQSTLNTDGKSAIRALCANIPVLIEEKKKQTVFHNLLTMQSKTVENASKIHIYVNSAANMCVVCAENVFLIECNPEPQSSSCEKKPQTQIQASKK